MDSFDRLRRCVNVLNNTHHGALEGFDMEEILRLADACRASDWDITPCDLLPDERDYAARTGILHKRTAARLKKLYG